LAKAAKNALKMGKKYPEKYPKKCLYFLILKKLFFPIFLIKKNSKKCFRKKWAFIRNFSGEIGIYSEEIHIYSEEKGIYSEEIHIYSEEKGIYSEEIRIYSEVITDFIFRYFLFTEYSTTKKNGYFLKQPMSQL
jgi:hypothetical protein